MINYLVCVFIAFFSFCAHSEDALKSILDQNATSEELKQVANLLKGSDNPPLSIDEAVAELCFGVDLCAQESSQETIDAICPEKDFTDPESYHFGGSCTAKRFRTLYSCNSEVEKQKVKTLDLLLQPIQAANQAYSSYALSSLIKFASEKLSMDVNMCDETVMGMSFEEFQKTHPDKMKVFEELAKDLPALGHYTMECYNKINPILYKADKIMIQRYFNLLASIKKTLEVLPEYKGKVNRGVNLPEHILKEHTIIGNVVCYNGFTSTAAHVEADYGNKPRNSFLSGCGQRLYINQTNPGLKYGRSVDKVSLNSGEKEVLFSPGACFRIDKVSPRSDQSEDSSEKCEGPGFLNIEMTLVDGK